MLSQLSYIPGFHMVGLKGLEPLTPALSAQCSNQAELQAHLLFPQHLNTDSKFLPCFLRKEVIQAHLPVHLPCYDFVPVTDPTFGGSLLAVGIPTSSVADFHDVTGGVYKTRERIQRAIADARLLATPSSCRRVAACNLN